MKTLLVDDRVRQQTLRFHKSKTALVSWISANIFDKMLVSVSIICPHDSLQSVGLLWTSKNDGGGESSNKHCKELKDHKLNYIKILVKTYILH